MTGSGDRPGREPQSASFEAMRVPSRRGSQPVFILGFLLFVGAFVAVGVGGRSAPQPTLPPAAVEASAEVTKEPTQAPTPAPTPHPFAGVPGAARLFESGPGLIVLEARRLPTSIYIHGDVFVPGVTWVYVSLVDGAGNVAGWTSVSVPGAAGPARSDGPALRFDVEMTVPDDSTGRMWLAANAYDARSSQIANVGLEVTLPSTSRMENEP